MMKLRDCVGLRNLETNLMLVEQGKYETLDFGDLDGSNDDYSDTCEDLNCGECYDLHCSKSVEYEPADINTLYEYGVFVDTVKNNVILAEASCWDQEDESLPDDMFRDVTGAITDMPYDYLINALNNSSNTLVYWYKCSGTTSDYVIYYNVVEDYRIGLADIYRLMYMGEEAILGKYCEVKDKKMTLLDF